MGCSLGRPHRQAFYESGQIGVALAHGVGRGACAIGVARAHKENGPCAHGLGAGDVVVLAIAVLAPCCGDGNIEQATDLAAVAEIVSHPAPKVLLIGLDAFLAFTSWHRWQDIMQLAHIIVARRPGSEISDAGPVGPLMDRYGTLDASDLYRAPAGKIIIHTVTQLEIASSTIRAMVGRGDDPKFLVAESVRKIIEESGCYANQNDTGGTT